MVDNTLSFVPSPGPNTGVFYHINNYIGAISADVWTEVAIIPGFRITTPDGVKYTFGMPWIDDQGNLEQYPVETNGDFFQQFYSYRVDSWYLAKIESPNSLNEIKFTYSQGDPIASFSRSIGVNEMSGQSDGFFRFLGPLKSSSTMIYSSLNGSLVLPQYLDKITTKNEEVIFSRSVSSEKKYSYSDVLQHLWQRSRETYRSGVRNYYYSNGVRQDGYWEFSGRRPLLLAGNSTFLSNGNGYYNGYAMLAGNIGVFSRVDLPIPSLCNATSCIYDCEIIDFNKLKWYQLDRVEIKNKTNETLKAMNFSYSSNSNERLRLLQLQQEGRNGQTIPPYMFEYEDYETNDYVASNNKLPPYNSFSLDHWGYFNGNIGRTFDDMFKDINNQYFTNGILSNYYSKRSTQTDFLYAGSLTRITYPTGGMSKFIYEPHQYVKKLNRNSTTGAYTVDNVSAAYTGGLRIKKIENYDLDNSMISQKNYLYDGGVLSYEAKYQWPNYQGKVSNGDPYTSNRFYSESILPVSSNSSGSHIGYSKVTEYESGNGKTVYYYQNYKDHSDISGNTYLDEPGVTIDPTRSLFSPASDRSIERGKIKEIRIYEEKDGLEKMARKEKFIYGANSFLIDDHVRAISTNQIPILTGTAIEGTAYKIYTYPYNLVRKEITNYDNLGNISHTVVSENKFNASNFIEEEVVTEPTGVTYKSEFKYPKDLCINYSSSTAPLSHEAKAIYEMAKELRMLNYPLETIQYKNGKVINASLQTYKEFLPNNYILPYKLYELEVNQAITDYQKAIIPDVGYSVAQITKDSRLKWRFTSNKYDKYSNPLEISSYTGITSAYVWGYNQSYPIATVENATYSEVESALGTDLEIVNKGYLNNNPTDKLSHQEMTLKLDPLHTSLPNAMVTTAAYKPLERYRC